MDSSGRTRVRALAGFSIIAAVGVAALASGFGDGDVRLGTAGTILWWMAYALYGVAFAQLVGVGRRRPPGLIDDVLVTVLLVAGAVVWLTSSSMGWTAALLVVSAATAASGWSPRTAWMIVAAQTVLVAVGTAIADGSTTDVALACAVYGSFQVFTVFVAVSERHELALREALSVAHTELRASSMLLETSARDAERLRISRDLHDVLGHRLTALALELEVAAHHIDPGADRTSGAADDRGVAEDDAATHIDRARTITKDLLRDVRSAVGRLRVADDHLERTLRALVADIPGLAVDLRLEEQRPTTPDQATVIVRWVQEVLTNTMRHADAARLWIDIHIDDTGVRMDARDDGHGVSSIEIGNGLAGLHERLQQAGGELVLDSTAGAGFVVSARIPNA